MSKQAIAIKTDGKIIQITLPKDPETEHNFIMSFIGDNPQPNEMFQNNAKEVFWTIPESKNFYLHPYNPVATQLVRSLYSNDIGIVRGNVLITGIGASDGLVATIEEENIELIMEYGQSIKKFLDEVDSQFEITTRKGK